MEITRESMFALCEELGEEPVKNKIPHWNPKKAKYANQWLRELESKRETARLFREERREEKSLAISKRALDISEKANSIASEAKELARHERTISIIAAIAAIVAAVAAIIAAVKTG